MWLFILDMERLNLRWLGYMHVHVGINSVGIFGQCCSKSAYNVEHSCKSVSCKRTIYSIISMLFFFVMTVLLGNGVKMIRCMSNYFSYC